VKQHLQYYKTANSLHLFKTTACTKWFCTQSYCLFHK